MSVVLIDMDGVIVDWTYSYEAGLAAKYPHLEFEKLMDFKPQDHLSVQHRAAINDVKYSEGFYRGMIPIVGAIEGVRTIAEAGHEVFFCSSPETHNPTCESDKKSWLLEFFGEAFANRLVLTRDKTVVRGDYLIDDRPDIHGVFTPEWEHIIFTQPYNTHVTDRTRLDDWSGWQDVIQ